MIGFLAFVGLCACVAMVGGAVVGVFQLYCWLDGQIVRLDVLERSVQMLLESRAAGGEE